MSSFKVKSRENNEGAESELVLVELFYNWGFISIIYWILTQSLVFLTQNIDQMYMQMVQSNSSQLAPRSSFIRVCSQISMIDCLNSQVQIVQKVVLQMKKELSMNGCLGELNIPGRGIIVIFGIGECQKAQNESFIIVAFWVLYIKSPRLSFIPMKFSQPKLQTLIILALMLASVQSNLNQAFQIQQDLFINPYSNQSDPDLMKSEAQQKQSTFNHADFILPNHLKKHFTFNGPLVTYKNDDNKVWMSVFVNRPIHIPKQPHQIAYTFKIQIVYSNGCNIMFGITDRANTLKTGRINSCFMDASTITYNGEVGCIWAQGKLTEKTNNMFKEGNIIVMKIIADSKNTHIEWSTNGKPLGSVRVSSEKLQQKDLIPYFEMFEKWDQVLWVE